VSDIFSSQYQTLAQCLHKYYHIYLHISYVNKGIKKVFVIIINNLIIIKFEYKDTIIVYLTL
ncbi:MAG: hypothetical protein RR734_05160, partial [Bacilli bacterium]